MPEKSIEYEAFPRVGDVLAELEVLRGKIKQAVQRTSQNNHTDSDLAVFRIVHGLSLTQWSELDDRLRLLDWMALPLEIGDYPALRRIQKKIDALAHAAGHDDLTGLARRDIFERTLASEMERTRRTRLSLSLAIFDIDDFKKINDRFGHAHGDLVLQRIAAILRENIRKSDLCARLGGEEFALLMPATTQSRAVVLLERIMDAIRKMQFDIPAPQTGQRVTISTGLACYKGFIHMQPEILMEMADQALYTAKRSGKDRIEKAVFKDISPQVSSLTQVDTDEKKFLFQTDSTKTP